MRVVVVVLAVSGRDAACWVRHCWMGARVVEARRGEARAVKAKWRQFSK